MQPKIPLSETSSIPLRMEYYPAGQIPAAVRGLSDELDRTAFAGLYPDDAAITWSTSQILATAWQADELVAQATLIERTARAGSSPVRLGGVGGVAVWPHRQGKGYGRRLMLAVQQYLAEKLGVEFGLLVCSDDLLAFYTRLGWQIVADPMVFEQPGGRQQRWPENTLILPCQERAWPGGLVDLCGLPW